MQQTSFSGRALTGPDGGAYSAPPDPLVGFRSCHAHSTPPFRPRLPCSYPAKSWPKPASLAAYLWRHLRQTVLLLGKCTVWRALTGPWLWPWLRQL